MSLEDHYGDILQKARSGHGWSHRELARRSGVHADRIRVLEEGPTRPSADELARLATCLEVDPERLQLIAEERWAPDPPSSALRLRVIPVVGSLGGYAVNAYLLCDPATGEAACVDTANAPDRVLAAASSARVRLTTILLTHTHPDHIGGLDRLQARSGALLCAHPDDRPALGSLWQPERDKLATEDKKISVGQSRLSVRWVPGHTHSGVCYLEDGALFVGDCLFAGSVGRAGSPEDYRRLLQGIREKLFTLPPATAIYPGHGPPTTVGEERAHNPFFLEEGKDLKT